MKSCFRNTKYIICATVFFSVLINTPSSEVYAASYSSLVKKGYSTGKLTKGRSGKLGWYVQKGDLRYFCRSRVSLVLVGSKGMIGFTTSGRQIKMSRKDFESRSSTKGLPKMSDIKAGRLRGKDVGRCTKQR